MTDMIRRDEIGPRLAAVAVGADAKTIRQIVEDEALYWAGLREGQLFQKVLNQIDAALEPAAPDTPERCPKCNGRGYIQWHPYWDNGNDPCDQCRPSKLAAPDPACDPCGMDPAAIREAALLEALEIAKACERQNYARVTDSEHHSHYRAGLRSAGQAIAAAIKSRIAKGAAE